MILKKKPTTEELVARNEAYVKELNAKSPLFVPYEVFKQSMEIYGENLKEIYSMMHTINMERPFSIEMSAGDFGFIVSGSKEDSAHISRLAQEMTEKILNKVFDKDTMKMLVKKETPRENVRDQNYA